MTPDSVPIERSADELEAEARILDDHGDYLWAKRLRELAAERRKQEGTPE